MKIIVEKSTGQVLFAGRGLTLDENGVKGERFIANNVKPDRFELVETSADIPIPFVGRAFKYIDSVFVIRPSKALEYKRIKNPVPDRVTMRQARLALLGAGLLSSIQPAINAMEEPHKSAAQIEWAYSSEVLRAKSFVNILVAQMGWTDEQLDDLFVEASKL